MSEELLPCPFCGGAAEIVSTTRPNGPSVVARCTRCKKGDTYDWNRKLTAAESWNTRTVKETT